jgi:hypothetical protein
MWRDSAQTIAWAERQITFDEWVALDELANVIEVVTPWLGDPITWLRNWEWSVHVLTDD